MMLNYHTNRNLFMCLITLQPIPEHNKIETNSTEAQKGVEVRDIGKLLLNSQRKNNLTIKFIQMDIRSNPFPTSKCSLT